MTGTGSPPAAGVADGRRPQGTVGWGDSDDGCDPLFGGKQRAIKEEKDVGPIGDLGRPALVRDHRFPRCILIADMRVGPVAGVTE